MVEVKVAGLVLDPANSPVVLLKELNSEKVLPIWIGAPEARAIALALEGIEIERPLTHDLMKSVIDGLKLKVSKVVVHDLRDTTFFAKLCLEKKGMVLEVDGRPSDCIALALRARAPIYVSNEIMKSNSADFKLGKEAKAEALRRYLKNLEPEDFGKYKL